MTIKTIGERKIAVYGVLAAFALFVLPVGQLAYASAAENGSLAGFIYAKDMKTPVTGAVVKIRDVGDRRELSSQPTDANGMFTIAGIPEGRYLLGITSGKEDFNFDYAMYIKAGELGKLALALAPGAAGQEPEAAPPKKPGFFNTVAGRALLVTAVGIAVYFIFFEPEPSPTVIR